MPQIMPIRSTLPPFRNILFLIPHGDTYRIFPITGDSMLPIADGSDVIGKYVSDWTDIKADTPCIVILNAD